MTATEEHDLLPTVNAALEDEAESICGHLLEKGRLRTEDLNKARAYQQQHGGNLLTLLVRLGLVSERDLAEAQSQLLDMPLIVDRTIRKTRRRSTPFRSAT